FNRLDPFIGSAASPASWHNYAYSDIDPINLLDPTGEMTATIGVGAMSLELLMSVYIRLQAFLPHVALVASLSGAAYATVHAIGGVSVIQATLGEWLASGSAPLAAAATTLTGRTQQVVSSLDDAFNALLRLGRVTPNQLRK